MLHSTEIENQQNEEQKINEKFVHKKIDKICGHPVKQKVAFNKQEYDADGIPFQSNDLTLGKYLEQIFIKSKKACEKCSLPISQHALEVYHLNGYVRITIQEIGQ